jgi:hypothetical protein
MNKFFNWIARLCKRRPNYTYEFVTELPEKFKERQIYICEHEGFAWQLNFLCPCGCKVLLYVNLLEDSKPYWRFCINKKGQISISPSLHRKVGCKSHFFVRNGKIEWAS